MYSQPYGAPPASAPNAPINQMAGMSLGPTGYQPPPPPSSGAPGPQQQQFPPTSGYTPPPPGHAPNMEHFPSRSSSSTPNQQVGGGSNFPQRLSQYNQPPQSQGRMQNMSGPPSSMGQAPMGGLPPSSGPPPAMGGPPASSAASFGPPPAGGLMTGPPPPPLGGRQAGGFPQPSSQAPPGQGGFPSAAATRTNYTGGMNAVPTGPPSGQPPSSMGQQGPPPRVSPAPQMQMGPPGQPTGPPSSMAPPRVSSAPGQPAPSQMQMGPPGMSMGPTGQAGPPTGPTSQPGLGMGPPGMQSGPQVSGPPGPSAPTSMSMGHPGMHTGPPGMQMGPGAPPGPGMQTGPPGMGPPGPGMQMGPPGTGMQVGPGAPGMQMGPPGTGMKMGPPGTGMQVGPGAPPGPGMGPGSHGMQMGPPGGPGMQMGPPGGPGMQMGPPGGPGMQMGPPGGPGMQMGPPGGPGMQMGPPGGPRMQMGPPGGPGMQMGPPGGPGMQMGPGGPPGSGMQPGPVQQQPAKSRIDPDQMPNPVEVMRADQEQHGGSTPYRTSTRGMAPPLVTTDFLVQDDGNVSPRYMRATMYTVPCSKDMLNSCKIPMGLVVQAFANIPANENTLHVVDHGSTGPIRCNRCKAYMNPYARFVDGGRKYLCPICQCSNEVAPEYFSHLDHQGRRTDALQRPELCYGSVEYMATKDYCKEGKLPRPPAYIFMIDVSYGNIQSGLLHLLFNSILGVLDNLPGSGDEEGSPISVGFVTYDRVIQFYNVKPNMAQPQMMVMTDVDDVFVPMVDGFLVRLSEARTVLESLMSQLPEIFSNNKTPQVVLEPVVRAGMEALKAAGRNGRLFVFHSSLPSAQATGMLKNRLDTKLLGTDKEKSLLNAASSPYQKLAEECVKYGVGVELFLFPSNYCDVATLGSFVASTGGQLHYYKNYMTSSDGDRLMEDLKHSLARPTAFDCVMRVRASTGLRPTGFYGAFFMSNTTDIELGNIDCDKAIAVEIKHDDKLRDDENAFFQAALLYTDVYGQRRLRIHNLSLSCSSKFPDVYRSCEIDTIITFLSKSILTASLTMPYKSIRENFTHQCAVILSCYRKHCSSQSPAGQLILPESLKLLPMYANCILKSDALLSPPIVSIDEKCWLLRDLLSMPITLTGTYIYPRMFALHDLDVNEKGLPPLMRCTGQKLQDNGLYVVENGVVMVLWVGQQLPPEHIQKLFGVPSLAQIQAENMYALPALDNALSFRVRGVLDQLQSSRPHAMKLIVTKQKDKSEVFFRRLLKEDKGVGQWEGITYIEFLCQIHREIKDILS